MGYTPIVISAIGILNFALLADSYSITSQTWTTGAGMPTARTEVAGAVLEDKVYIIGGFDETGNRSNVVEIYDPKKIHGAEHHLYLYQWITLPLHLMRANCMWLAVIMVLREPLPISCMLTIRQLTNGKN